MAKRKRPTKRRTSKKRKTEELYDFVSLCQIIVPKEIFIQILEYLPTDRTFLNGPGLVNHQWYILCRSKEIWHTIKISNANQIHLMPVYFLKNCKHLCIRCCLNIKDIEKIMKYVDDVESLDVDVKGWDTCSFKKIFTNETMKKRLNYLSILNICNKNYVDVVTSITSNNLQVLKLTARESNINKTLVEHISNFRELYWLKLEDFTSEYCNIKPILQNCKKLIGLELLTASLFSKVEWNETFPTIEYLSLRVNDMNSVSEFIKCCPNLKCIKFDNFTEEILDILPKTKIQDVIYTGYTNVINWIRALPTSVRKIRALNVAFPDLTIFETPFENIKELMLGSIHNNTIKNIVELFPNLEVLRFDCCNASTEEILQLKKLPNLRNFISISATIPIKVLDEIAKSTQLQCIVNYDTLNYNKYNKPYSIPDAVKIPMLIKENDLDKFD